MKIHIIIARSRSSRGNVTMPPWAFRLTTPISALVLNAEAALQLLRAQPTDTGAVRRLLVCIVKDGLRTGDIVHRTRALIEKAPPVSETQCPVNVDSSGPEREKKRRSFATIDGKGLSAAGISANNPS